MNNVRGLKSKLITTKRIIQEENPVIIALVETKMRDGEEIELPGYRIARGEGGGVLLAYKETLSNILVSTKIYDKNGCEMVWAKIENSKVKMKIGVVYMPQESRTKLEVLKEIYNVIENEVKEAAEHGFSLLIVGDFNCKVGNFIGGNTNEITKGGRLLTKMINRNKMAMVNAQQDICKGLWTRIEGMQKSVIDYVICFEEDLKMFKQMDIDEEKNRTPYHIEEGSRKYTDHCMISGTLNITLMEETQPKYVRVLGTEGWSKFREAIERENISKIIDGRCIQSTYLEWNDKVLKIKDSCSKKVKLKRTWKVNRKLTTAKNNINRELKKKEMLNKEQIEVLKQRRNIILQQIEEEEQKQEHNRVIKIVDEVKRAGGINSSTFWDVRKKICNKTDEPAHSIKNKDGELCENPEEIKKVYAEWYQNLLKTRRGETEVEKEAEEVVELLWNSMKTIAASQPARKTTYEEIEKVVSKLDPKKARDAEQWKNNIMKEGGREMIKSLQNIVNQVDEQMVIPNKWQEMQIKVTHKRGDKTEMGNKRGLFLTNNVSKVYERVVKERNEKDFTEGITPWNAGGIKNRSAVDIALTVTCIIEQNQYLKRTTYLTVTDAEKCFDKLWLLDGIYELWRCGTDIRDCCMIKRLNEKATVVVKTPVGDTEPFTLEDIVRQGSVYGPQICISSMDKVNLMGKDVVTHYGPNLPIKAVAFIDDVSGAGGGRVADNLIYNCNIMEERKKMTFNNTNQKTEYMVIAENKEEEIHTVTSKVKKGGIQRVAEHKLVGTWFGETGEYGINIRKKNEKLQFMISTTKNEAHPKNMGNLAVDARLKLAEIVVVHSILYNAEAYHIYKEAEIKELEKIQHSILVGILELPGSTPYFGLLMETGWWTMRGRLAYKKLMLYQNIATSDDKRVVKKMINAQKEMKRSTTWYSSIQQEIQRYGIELNAEESLKSSWKKHMKTKIGERMEVEIREECSKLRKTRTVTNNKYEKKQYLSNMDLNNIKKVIKTRLHMSKHE